MKKYILNFSACFILLFTSLSFPQNSNSPVPEDSQQMLLMLADSSNSTKGYLYRFERDGNESDWESVDERIPVVLGRNGLAWGRGLHPIDSLMLPTKVEGDGKSPAGIFTLTYAFGYTPSTEMTELNINYLEITTMRECIDDVKSQYYNKLVNNNEVDSVDWQSSEKMYFADIYYQQGVVVDQNIDPIIKGAGSCIFLHNWSNPDETSVGCTEMSPENMKRIIYWLDYSAYPILIQLTKQLYKEYQQSWELPKKISITY